MARRHLSVVREQFERQAEIYSRNEVVTDPAVLRFVVSVSAIGPADRALDVACGPGFLTLALARRARAVIGVDITPRFLAAAHQRATAEGIVNATFLPADVERLAFTRDSFDVVTCKFAFHHFPRPERVLAEMKRVARPGGRIVILDMLTSEDARRSREHDRIERLCDPSHARALSGSAFDRLFARFGLGIVYQRKGEATEPLAEWIRHGSPPPGNAARIVRWMERHVGAEDYGIEVSRRNGALFVAHRGATYVLEKPG